MRLRSLARDGGAKLLLYSGAPRALRWVHRRGYATILLYHDPKPDVLDAHLTYLREHFAFTTLDAVVDAIARGDWYGVPPGGLVLTLDDGHRGNHALLPVFVRHGVRPTIYLCSQIVGTRRHFWFQHPGVAADAYKRIPDEQRRTALAERLDFDPERDYADERQALSLDEIRAMASSVDFEVHTRFHPVLTQCSDDDAWREIADSKRELEALLGRPCRHFSYPNGDYGSREVELARRAGFASARTVDIGWTHVGSDPFRLKMFGVSDDVSIDMLAAQLSGIPGYVRRLLQGQRGGRWPVAPSARR